MTVIVAFFTRLVHKYMPDAFVVAIALTILTVVLAVVAEGTTVNEATKYWGDGFWTLLSFTMQMTVILVTGYILAKTPLVNGVLEKVTKKVKTPRQAVVVATVVGILGCWFNWGFGLIVGSLVARKLAINVKGLHYPLAIAAAYSGLSVYGIGLSGTVPLVISTDGHFMESAMGIVPLKETIFSPVMLATSVLILLTLPFFNALMHPKDKDSVHEIDRSKISEEVDYKASDFQAPVTFSQKMNNSKVLGVSIGLLGLYYIYIYIADGGALNLNILNFGFLFLGIILFASPAKFLQALNDAVKTVAGVIIQYPFYAGIMGILVGSGLMVSFSNFFTGFATAETLPFWSFVSGGIINVLAPSGGGQWAVQGPVMIEAARELGASYAATATAVQIGDQWTNMVQPFWLLPALAISGLKLKEIMGYLVLVLVYLGVIFGGAVIIWGGA
ncbi:MAG: short-chain fatty acids transporter [Halomonas sp. 54_146]|nr:TIGR00366 family protein [Halomonas sp. 54_146]KUJ86667.1 MAG: short-chain fatty acids transporter [Halomonas sp. 54_146]